MNSEYLEDPKPCPNCRQTPSEHTGLCPPVFIGGIECGSWYGRYLRCECGNESKTSPDLQEIYRDWNERIIPMIESGDCKYIWPHNYMNTNAKDIYNKLVDNVEIPSTDYLYDEDGYEVDLDFYETIRDIAIYLDDLGVKLNV
jgi:hypothetical protein